MVDEGCVEVIYKLLVSCNRSTPHQKIVRHALRCLANISKHPRLLPALIEHPSALGVLVDLSVGYRENEVIHR